MKRWIHDIRFTHKLTAIVIASLVPISLLTFLFMRAEQAKLATARLELAGLAAYRPLEGMLAPLADMQLWAAAQAAGDPAAKDKLAAARTQVEKQMAVRVAAHADYGAPAGEDERRWGAIQSDWNALAGTKFANVAEANQRYSDFRAKLLDLKDYVTATSGMVLDPDSVDYFLIVAATDAVPSFEANIGQMRSDAAAIGASGSATVAQISAVVRAQVLAQNAVDVIKRNLEHTAEAGSRGQEIRSAVSAQVAAVEKNLADFSQFVQTQVTNSTISAPLDDVLAKSDGIMNAAVQLHAMMTDATEKALQDSVSATARARNLTLAIVLLTLAAGLAAAALTCMARTSWRA